MYKEPVLFRNISMTLNATLLQSFIPWTSRGQENTLPLYKGGGGWGQKSILYYLLRILIRIFKQFHTFMQRLHKPFQKPDISSQTPNSPVFKNKQTKKRAALVFNFTKTSHQKNFCSIAKAYCVHKKF